MKTKKKRIAQEIQSRILTIVIAIFMVVAVVVAVMVGNVSLSAQKNDLEMQSKAASYQLEIFFQEYMTIVEQMALDKDVRTLLTETKAGDKITESADYQTVFHEMEKIAAADSDNIQAVWLGDIDANVATQSDGFTSDSSFEITERTWYRAVETNSTILTSAYVEASTGNLILSAAAPVYDENGKNIIGVAGADIALEHIDELLSAYKIGNNGFVILVTSDGTIIYHPNSDNQLKNLSELNVSDSVMKAIQSQNGTSVKYKADGSSKYGYVGRIGTTDYYTLSCMPSSEYLASLIQCIIIVLLLVIVGVVIIIMAIRRLAGNITKPIVALNEVAQELAEGNLDVSLDVSSENEIGELADSIQKTVNRLKEYINYIDEIAYVLNRLSDGKLKFTLKYDYAGDFAKVKDGMMHISESLQGMIENIINSSAQVSAGADDLSRAAQNIAEGASYNLHGFTYIRSRAAQNIAEGASTQAASVEELVATSVSVSEQVKENTDDALKSADETARVTKMMQDSRMQMDQMTDAMNKITETSNEVVSIIKTIEDIADQTNLLALNASIEAARAGEAGKGFAVVASEIGSLAEGSSKAANNTKDLIGVSIQEIERGTELAANVVVSMQEVLDAIENVNGMIGKSAENNQTQNQNIEQIKLGIEEISKAVEDNSASAEETSATSEELAAQAATLEALVKHFDLEDDGSNDTTR